jgi:hypothetical protein
MSRWEQRNVASAALTEPPWRSLGSFSRSPSAQVRPAARIESILRFEFTGLVVKAMKTGNRNIDDLAGLVISTKLACVLLKLTQPRLSQLEAAGWIARVAPGRWRLLDLVQGYVSSLKDETKRSSQTASLSRVQEARAREIEMRTARDSGQTVDMSDALALVDDVVGGFKADFDGLPARYTRNLEERRRLETEINDVFTRAANRLDAESDLARAGGTADQAEAEV